MNTVEPIRDEGTVQDHRQVTAYQNQITAGDRFPIIRPQIAQGTVLEQNGHAQQADIDQLDKMPGGSAQPGEIPQAEQQLQKGHQADLLWIIGQIREGGVDNIFISKDPFSGSIVYR